MRRIIYVFILTMILMAGCGGGSSSNPADSKPDNAATISDEPTIEQGTTDPLTTSENFTLRFPTSIPSRTITHESLSILSQPFKQTLERILTLVSTFSIDDPEEDISTRNLAGLQAVSEISRHEIIHHIGAFYDALKYAILEEQLGFRHIPINAAANDLYIECPLAGRIESSVVDPQGLGIRSVHLISRKFLFYDCFGLDINVDDDSVIQDSTLGADGKATFSYQRNEDSLSTTLEFSDHILSFTSIDGTVMSFEISGRILEVVSSNGSVVKSYQYTLDTYADPYRDVVIKASDQFELSVSPAWIAGGTPQADLLRYEPDIELTATIPDIDESIKLEAYIEGGGAMFWLDSQVSFSSDAPLVIRNKQLNKLFVQPDNGDPATYDAFVEIDDTFVSETQPWSEVDTFGPTAFLPVFGLAEPQ